MIQVITKNKSNYINEIKAWLIDEYKLYSTGFYVNWSSIESSHQSKKIAYLKLKNEIIGFITWLDFNLEIHINIIEIKIGYRLNGYGKIFINEMLEFFKLKGFYSVSLQCAPIESKKFWLKLGFLSFEKSLDKAENKLYKPLVINLKPTKDNSNSNYSLELWNEGKYFSEKNKIEPKWIWKMQLTNNYDLINPIIHYSDKTWRLRLNSFNHILYDDDIKYFKNLTTFYDNLFIIKSISNYLV